MTKIEVLKYNQAVMAPIGLYSYRLTEPTNEFFNCPATYYILFAEGVLGFVGSAAFVYNHWPNFNLVSQPCLINFGTAVCSGMFISIGLKLKTIKMLHLKLQEMVDEVEEEPEVHNIYWSTEQKCRQFTKTLSYTFFSNGVYLFPIIKAIYDIATGNYDTSAWVLPFFISVPFDTESIWGWCVLLFININISIAYFLAIPPIVSYFVSCCFYTRAICDHFDVIVGSVEEDVHLNKDEKNLFKYMKREKKIKENLCKAIRIHIKAHEIFELAAEVNGGAIFSLFPPNVIFTALALYNMEHSEFDIVMFATNIICLCASLFLSTIVAYFATSVTNRLSVVGFTAYNCNWFEYPVELRKYMILIIARSQQPAHFTGLKLFPCTLELFGELFKTSCSYYWFFRSLGHR